VIYCKRNGKRVRMEGKYILLRITCWTWEKSMRPLSPKPLASSLGKRKRLKVKLRVLENGVEKAKDLKHTEVWSL
jgi:hypothetical protein